MIDKKISEINIADVLRMIRQNEFLDVAIYKAMFLLKDNPFIGEAYDGELLEKISDITSEYFKNYLCDMENILLTVSRMNKTYEWCIESERTDFERLIIKMINKMNELTKVCDC